MEDERFDDQIYSFMYPICEASGISTDAILEAIKELARLTGVPAKAFALDVRTQIARERYAETIKARH